MKYKTLLVKKWKHIVPIIILFALSLGSIYFFSVNYTLTGILFLLAFILPATTLLIKLIYLDSCYFIFNDSSIVYHSLFKKDTSFNVDDSLLICVPDEQIINNRNVVNIVINNNKESFVYRISDEGITLLKEKYKNNVESYLILNNAIKHPTRRNFANGLRIAGGIIEGGIIGGLVIALSLYLLFPPPIIKTKTTDYHYIYDIVKESNKHKTPSGKKKTLLGYGEYMYNSFLLLTPRETPSSLTSFYFRYKAGMDVDALAYYFACQLDEISFENYKNGLDNFIVNVDGFDHHLIKDEEHFEYLAYIAQWLTPSKKWESLEYVLLDIDNHTVIYVYSFLNCLDQLEKNSSYVIKPNVDVEHVIDGKNNIADGFSIYLPDDLEDLYYHIDIAIDDLNFDNSFLKWLM